MIVNQKVKVKGTNEYGYISIPVIVEIIWDNDSVKGHATLDELELVGNRLHFFNIKERKYKPISHKIIKDY